MASALPPVKGAAFSFELSLVSQADTDTFQDNPTLAAGDVKVIKDGTLDGNIDTLPTAVTSLTRVITVALSADEMTADRVTVLFHDAAGSEWQDALVTIYTAAQTLDTTDGVADGIKAKTDYLPAAAAGASGGLPVLDGNLAASANVTYSAGVALTGRLAQVTDLPAAAPSAASVADAVWDEAISGHLTAGTTGAKLNTASSLAGTGSTAYTNTITDTGSNPLDGVEVWITSDSGGAATVASTTTNTLGAFTVYLDPGTYYLWLAKGGYNFGNPTTITVT